MKKPAKVAVSAAAAGAVAIAFGAWSGLPLRLVAGAVTAKIETASGRRVKFGSPLELQVWPSPSVVARDVSVVDGEDPLGVDIKLDRVRIALAWSGLLTGTPHVTEVELTRPQARIPLVRERKTGSSQDMPDLPTGVTVDRVVVNDAALILVDDKTGTEHRVDHLAATIERPTSPTGFVLKADITMADRPVSIEARGSGQDGSRPAGVLPVEFKIDSADLPPLAGLVDLRFGDAILSVDASRIDVGPNRFTGQISVDLGARKPFVSASLDVRTLDLAAFDTASHQRSNRKASRANAWSDDDLGLDGLNYFDGEVTFTAARAVHGNFSVSPLAFSAKLRRGTGSITLGSTTIGDGQVQGKVILEAAGPTPSLKVQADAAEVDLEPVMRDLADFRGFAGHASARVDLTAQGSSARALVASLSGTTSGKLHDGDIGGQDLARTVGSLAARLMTGRDPQEIGGFKVNELSGSMRFDRGQGSTQDFLLDSSLVRMTGQGKIDLPRQAVAFEFKPKLSLGKSQTGLPGSIDIGVPFNVDGPWSAPSVQPGNGLPTISSEDFGFLPRAPETDTAPRAQPNDIVNNIGSLVSDLIAKGVKASPNGFDEAGPDANR